MKDVKDMSDTNKPVFKSSGNAKNRNYRRAGDIAREIYSTMEDLARFRRIFPNMTEYELVEYMKDRAEYFEDRRLEKLAEESNNW